MADALRRQHKLGESEEIYQRVAEAFRAGGERYVLAYALRGIAAIRREQGRYVGRRGNLPARARRVSEGGGP